MATANVSHPEVRPTNERESAEQCLADATARLCRVGARLESPAAFPNWLAQAKSRILLDPALTDREAVKLCKVLNDVAVRAGEVRS